MIANNFLALWKAEAKLSKVRNMTLELKEQSQRQNQRWEILFHNINNNTFFLALHMLKKQKKIILFILQGNGKEDSANTGKNIQKFISFTRRQSFQGEGKGN